MKKFSKKIFKSLAVLMTAALVFANSGMKALADDIRFYVVKKGEIVTDDTTSTVTYGVSTDKFYELEQYKTSVTDESVKSALNGINNGSFYNERTSNTFDESVVSQNVAAEDLTVEQILDKLGITYDGKVDWYVIKKHNDGYHVDGTNLKQ